METTVNAGNGRFGSCRRAGIGEPHTRLHGRKGEMVCLACERIQAEIGNGESGKSVGLGNGERRCGAQLGLGIGLRNGYAMEGVLDNQIW